MFSSNHTVTENQILEKKKELFQLAAKNGLTNNKVVKCSQELDFLILQMQRAESVFTK